MTLPKPRQPRQHRHRLFHTLVFSSLLALDGCGEAAPTAAPAAESERGSSSGGDAASRRSTYAAQSAAPVGRSAATPPTAEATESPEALIAASDVRYCEAGWPTTKGGTSGPRCTTVTDDGTERVECEDREGPCVQRPE